MTTNPPQRPNRSAAQADRIFLFTLWAAVGIFAATMIGLIIQLIHGLG